MKIFEKSLQLNTTNIPDELINGSLFLDIETTGLDARRSHLYLFGCVYREPAGDDTWHFKQWLLESPFEERAALREICAFVQKFTRFIHYNGDHFDLPYLDAHARACDAELVFLDKPGIDLYKLLRPAKKLLGLPASHQKDFEVFAGIVRDDKYDGGKLIKVYHDYCVTGSSELLELLLLHNREDVLGMVRLMELKSYADFVSGKNRPLSQQARLITISESELIIEFSCPKGFIKPVTARFDKVGADSRGGTYLHLEDDALRLRLPLIRGEMKYFFPRPKDYYYLPREDMAVHKSVAAYVDKNHRIQSTPETNYIKKQGVFFPVTSGIFKETYHAGYGTAPYALWDESLLDAEHIPCWNRLIDELLTKI